MEVIGERGKRHFVYANLLICNEEATTANILHSNCNHSPDKGRSATLARGGGEETGVEGFDE